jgi:hypothetical protein
VADHLSGALSAFAFLASPLQEQVISFQLQSGYSPKAAFATALVMAGVSYMIGLNGAALIRTWRQNPPKL